MWKNEKAKREREKEEEKKEEERKAVLEKEGYVEIDYTKPPIRSHVAAKKKFGNIASEIAAKLRKAAKERKEKQKIWQKKFGHQQNNSFVDRRRQRDGDGGDEGGDNNKKKGTAGKAPFNSADAKNNKNKSNNNNSKKEKEKEAPPPPPPEPTKQDRKLSALEARLAALQAKLKKK